MGILPFPRKIRYKWGGIYVYKGIYGYKVGYMGTKGIIIKTIGF
jgi:hypothetical protein